MFGKANPDIRWIQRLDNYTRAFKQLEEAINLLEQKGELSELEKQGLIQIFEYTFELAWNLIRDYLISQGFTDIRGSKDAFRMAFKYGLIKDGQLWMEMIGMRNLTSHTYNKETAERVIETIVKKYYEAFKSLLDIFSELKLRELSENDKE